MKRLVSGQYNNFEKVLSIYDELSPENTQILYNKYRDLFSDKFDNNEDLCALIEKIQATYFADCQTVELLSDLQNLSEKKTELKLDTQKLCIYMGNCIKEKIPIGVLSKIILRFCRI